MSEVYKTVGSEDGTKQHVIQEVNERTGNEIILCSIGIDQDQDCTKEWKSKEQIHGSNQVCEICKKELFDPEIHIQRFKSSTNKSLIQKIMSAIPWV
jgi:hypothetical protein